MTLTGRQSVVDTAVSYRYHVYEGLEPPTWVDRLRCRSTSDRPDP